MPLDPDIGPRDTWDIPSLLARLAPEVQKTAQRCASLQWTISTLLDKVHHPDLGEEIHMLQDIDRLQQTLCDIASVIEVLAASPETTGVSQDAISAAIRLESFRDRLDLTRNPKSEQSPEPKSNTGSRSDITWF